MSIVFINIIFLFLLAFIPNSTSINKLKFILSSDNQMIISIGIGTPPQYFNVMVDTSSSYLCIFDEEAKGIPYTKTKVFNKKDSSTYEEKATEEPTIIKYLSSQVTVKESIDEITLEDNTKVKLAFGLIKEAKELQLTLPKEADGIIGLGFNYEDTPGLIVFSLLYKLEVNGKAEKSTIQIEYTDNTSGYITLGNNINTSASLSKWGSCSPTRTGVDQDYIRWVCNSDFIELGVISQNGNDIIRNEQDELFKFIFDTSINHLLFPYSLFSTIQAKVFKSFAPSDCEVKESTSLTHYEVICKSTIVKSNIIPINIVFTGGEVMIIDSRNAFIERVNKSTGEKEYVFIVKYLKKENQFANLLVIGQPLLQSFALIFHKNNEKIYFFSNEFYKSLSIRTWIFIVLGIIAVIVIIMLVIGWYVMKYIMKNYFHKIEHVRLTSAAKDLFTHLNLDDDSDIDIIKEEKEDEAEGEGEDEDEKDKDKDKGNQDSNNKDNANEEDNNDLIPPEHNNNKQSD